MAIGRVDYKKSTNLEPVASAITSMGQSASKKDKPEVLGEKIKKISTDATAVETKVLQGETFYAAGQKKTGTMPNRGTWSNSLGINGSITIPEGYHNGQGKITQSIVTKGAQTYTPKTTNQTIVAGQYLSGAQTILGEPNLVPANIVKGKTIFGVTGSFVMPESPVYYMQSGVATSSLGAYRQVSNIPFKQPVYSSNGYTYLPHNSGSPVFVAFSNSIDVSLYKYLNFHNYDSWVYSTNAYFGLISANALANAVVDNLKNRVINSSTGWSAVYDGSNAQNRLMSLNIENLSGNYYIAFGMPKEYQTWSIKDIYLSILI